MSIGEKRCVRKPRGRLASLFRPCSRTPSLASSGPLHRPAPQRGRAPCDPKTRRCMRGARRRDGWCARAWLEERPLGRLPLERPARRVSEWRVLFIESPEIEHEPRPVWLTGLPSTGSGSGQGQLWEPCESAPGAAQGSPTLSRPLRDPEEWLQESLRRGRRRGASRARPHGAHSVVEGRWVTASGSPAQPPRDLGNTCQASSRER